ncbi:unnamed protein product [Symbiodinium sp. CCMP2592]|nr:unnamed protein product [Symbiodinium sp. CCMP2592]
MMMLLMVVLPSLLTGGLAIRDMTEEPTEQQQIGPEVSQEPGEASPIKEAAAERKKTLEEKGDTDTNMTECRPVTVKLPHLYRPGVVLSSTSSGQGAAVLCPAYYVNESCASRTLLGKHLSGRAFETYVRKIGDLDASQHDYETILLHWASMVRGRKDYPVELGCDVQAFTPLGDVDYVLVACSCAALLPLLLVFACLGVFIVPCFFCRLCGACGGIVLAAVPPGPQSPDHVATWLEQSWFTRATDWSCVRVGVVIVFASLLLWACFPLSGFPTLQTAVVWFICLCHLMLGLSVIWGLRCMSRVTFAYSAEDLRMSLRSEFRLIACMLAPKILLSVMLCIGMLCAGLPVVCCQLYLRSTPLVESLLNPWSVVRLLAFLCCEGLTFLMMSRFLLEAAIAGRIVEAEIVEVKRGLDIVVADPDLVTKARTGCGRLAKEILPELAKISGPTLCLAALKGATHFAYVIGWLDVTGHLSDSAFATEVFLCTLCLAWALLDLLVGPLCLFLPARVSDAFADLLEILNELRIKPVKEGCSAEVDREIRLIRSFIKDANRGNGLGFKLLGTVVDKQTIISMATKLIAASSVVVTLLRQVYKVGQDEMEAQALLRGDGAVYS